MSLTPKNWQTFQHYKDRAPIWIKLHRALLDDADFQCLPIASKALAPMLWLVASEYEGGCITVPAQKIAWRLRMSLDEFTEALRPLIDGGFFDASEPLAPCKQEAMPEKRREETEREEETETESLSGASAPRPKAASRFEEFWKAYPRRKGDNPRKTAEGKFNALVKTGLDPQMLIDAIKQYAADKADKIGTEFIPMASTWLNQQRWTDHAAVAALQALGGEAAQFPIEDVVKMFAKGGYWSRHAGPAPGLTGCKASAELLAKYGLLPDGRKMPANEPA
ncbi:hypothetical protein [Bradyrhizobium sp. OK095]|uniref:hypothetical protein n=1 Tax=Bradyrhizobium sp. OK095 TaxID=1882760 RepID=UPI0008C6F776|nr:hypothetical protein [Bradyrhizobium sp. OK095]SEN67354.1 hypothetical protein SAMN05443254_11039 [Bradyrhizobium sp. OK095]